MTATLSRATTKVALLLLMVMALAGCTSDVTTTFAVTSPTQATVVTEVAFTGDAAIVLSKDDSTLAELVAVFTTRLGTKPHVEVHNDSVVVSTTLAYADLAKVSDLTGVRAARLSPSGDLVQITVDVSGAPRVVEAITKAAASEPEPQAVTTTMLKTTHLVTRVSFAGGITTASTSAKVGALSTGRHVATLTRTAADSNSTALVVTGKPDANRWLWMLGGALVALAAGGALLRRRR